MQARMAMSAPVLRPAGRNNGSTLQDRMVCLASQLHTRISRVLVLLRGGTPLSLISMGRAYTSCVILLKLLRMTTTVAVLSVEFSKKRQTGDRIIMQQDPEALG